MQSRSVPLLSLFVAFMSAVFGCSRGDERAQPYDDPAPHTSGFVTTEAGVRLHYLDFGGTGEALVLLAGAGNSAHVFDEFAPALSDRFHVVALTRRGFGESSQPADGYDAATLADDIRSALDALDIARAHFVGHSIAGFEMTSFAAAYPERVDHVVYLDAAYDWSFQASHTPAASPPTAPRPTAADRASPATFAQFLAHMNGVPSFPEADVRATNLFASGGSYVRPVTPASITSALATAAAAESPTYSDLEASVLAIYTVPDSVTDMFPWLTPASSQWAAANVYFEQAQALLAQQREAFAKALPEASIQGMHGVPHYLFLADLAKVENAVRSFLSE